MHYPVHSRDRIFVKGYGFLSFARNIIIIRFSLKPLHSAKQYDIHALKLLQKKRFKKQQKPWWITWK